MAALPPGVRSTQFAPLPRRPGERKYIATSGPMQGQAVSEWTVRKLRAQEQGFGTPRQVTTAYASPRWREIVERTAAEKGITLDQAAANPDLNRAFIEAFVKGERPGHTRTWQEAEEANARDAGYLLWSMGAITSQEYYRYFASRGAVAG